MDSQSNQYYKLFVGIDLYLFFLDSNQILNFGKKLLIDLYGTQIRRLNSISFQNLPNLTNLYVGRSAFDELEPKFFDNLPSIYTFGSEQNWCADVRLSDVKSINFTENKVLNQCFANWYVPRDPTTTTSTTVAASVKLNSNFLVIFFAAVLTKFILN